MISKLNQKHFLKSLKTSLVKLYEQANAAQGEAGQATDAQEAPRDDNTFDGDFEESK